MADNHRVNGPNIVSDVIDGEVLIINLEKGIYYSLAAPGAEIWEALRGGATRGQVQQLLLARYEGDAGEISRAVDDLVRELEAESILVAADSAPSTASMPAPEPQGERIPFERPVLQRYTDMEAILMLDPIHEVDQHGWPAAKPER